MKKEIKKSWSRMTKVEKRKSIASDVILQIKSKILNAKSGDYCDLNISYDSDSKEFQKNLGTIKNSCQACAMGSMMAADIISRNNYSGFWDSNSIIIRFKNIFSEFQLRLIETSFELEVIEREMEKLQDFDGNPTEISKKAIKFGSKYKNENNRLIAIMNNIIEDPKGLFFGIN